ncbi:chemotaxis protein CheC [Bacillota bacterium LX-D]|nr:chemotaxis protein CheC [Bacillota bacterium LX-D]
MDQLTNFELDVLQEIGNIGAGNAASALAKLLNKRIDMTVPKAGVMPLNDICSLIGNEEDKVACIDFSVDGEAKSQILFLLSEESSYYLIDMLFGNPMGTTKELDAMGLSALQEIGNILSGSFLTAFSDVTKLSFIYSVPQFAFDMLGAVLSAALLEGGYFEDQVLIIETQFYQNEIKINGHFFLVPENGSLKVIFDSLGL